MTILEFNKDVRWEGSGFRDEYGVEMLSDLNRVWEGCYVSILNEQWYVEALGTIGGELCMKINCLTSQRRKRRAVSFDHVKLDKIHPHLGYFNTKTSSIYLSRKINRQWKQGIHPNTVTAHIPFGDLISRTSGMNMWAAVGMESYYEDGLSGLSCDVNFFDPTYLSYQQGVNKLTEGEMISAALSRDVALALHPANGEVHVMYHEEPVGAVDVINNTLILREGYAWIRETLEEVIIL